MGKHLVKDLDSLKRDLLMSGSLVEEAFNHSVNALVNRNTNLAEAVIEGDYLINERENQIEEEALKILALHQPVAADLRFIISVLKVNNDLERIGDLAVNIAERAIYLSSNEPLQASLNFPLMAEAVLTMLRKSLDALIGMDTELARYVLTLDDEVDDLNREMYITLQNVMRENPEAIDRSVQTLSVSRYLERIADLSTNIAEDVVFMVDGDLIRHKSDDHR